MEDEKDEYTDSPPSHILYEGKNMIYIKNKISSNILAISKSNLEMNNISFNTLKNLSDLTWVKIYGIIGIANFKGISCIIFGTDYDVITFYLDKAVYKIKNINYKALNIIENDLKEKIDKKI